MPVGPDPEGAGPLALGGGGGPKGVGRPLGGGPESVGWLNGPSGGPWGRARAQPIKPIVAKLANFIVYGRRVEKEEYMDIKRY